MRIVFVEFTVVDRDDTYKMLVALDAIRSVEPVGPTGNTALVVLDGATHGDTLTQFEAARPYAAIRDMLSNNAYAQTVVVPC